MVATRIAIGATAPIVIVPAITRRALLRAVPFTTPLPLALSLAVRFPPSIFSSFFAVMVVLMILMVTMAVVMLAVITFAVAVLLALPRCFTSPDFSPSIIVTTMVWSNRSALFAVCFPLPLWLVYRRRCHGTGRSVLACYVSIGRLELTLGCTLALRIK